MNCKIGKRIRTYRKAKGMSIEELGRSIFKSKSTISKYERGIVSIDIETLSEIAKVLKVSLDQLIETENSYDSQLDDVILSRKVWYLYHYDEKLNIVYSILETKQTCNDINALLYYDIGKNLDIEKHTVLYYGSLQISDSVINIHLHDQVRGIEQLLIVAIRPIKKSESVLGLILGLTNIPLRVHATKMIISFEKLKELDVKYCLLFSKKEIQTLKDTNQLLV